MDEKMQKKLNELLASVEARNVRYHKAVVRTGIIYAILALFVLGYTSFIYWQISTQATPENLAILLVDYAREQLPLVREGAREKMQPAAEAIADKMVDSGIELIPVAGSYVRSVVDEQVDQLLENFEKKDLPVIEDFLNDSLIIVLENEKAKDPTAIGQALTKQVSVKINEQLDKIINAEFYCAISSLQAELTLLRSKKVKNMSSREYAEREFIFCWLRLNELAEMEDADDSFLSILSGLSGSAAEWMGDDGEE